MITKIVLENFMSHRRTVIEPAEGLTVLTGPNNCGKSAVVTALQTLCGNERGSQLFVRHGEKMARVIVETDEGHTLEWRREGSTVSYRINGRDVHRLRGSIPEDLDELLRLKPVSAAEGAEPFQVHFSEQKQPIFLLNETPGRAATFFASASDTRLLLAMQRKAQERRRDKKREADLLEARVIAGQERLSLFEPVESIDRDLQAIERAHDDLTKKIEIAKAMVVTLQGLRLTQAKVSEHRQHCEQLKPLSTPPVLDDAESLKRALQLIQDSSRRRNRGLRQAKAITSLKTVPELPATEVLEQTCNRLTGLEKTLHRAKSRTTASKSLALCPDLEPTDDLARTVRLIQSLLTQSVQLEKAATKVSALGPMPEPLLTEPLERLVQDWERSQKALDQAHSQGQAAVKELEDTRRSLNAYVAEHPTCPLCGGALTAEQVLAGGHAHE